MAETRMVAARVPPALEAAARRAAPELAALDLSTLVRVGLAVLAGHPVSEAVQVAYAARQPRGGPRPGAGAKPRREAAA